MTPELERINRIFTDIWNLRDYPETGTSRDLTMMRLTEEIGRMQEKSSEQDKEIKLLWDAIRGQQKYIDELERKVNYLSLRVPAREMEVTTYKPNSYPTF